MTEEQRHVVAKSTRSIHIDLDAQVVFGSIVVGGVGSCDECRLTGQR